MWFGFERKQRKRDGEKRGRSLSTQSFIIWCRSFFLSFSLFWFSVVYSAHSIRWSFSFISFWSFCLPFLFSFAYAAFVMSYIYIWIDAVLIACVLCVCECECECECLFISIFWCFYTTFMCMIYKEWKKYFTHMNEMSWEHFLFDVAHKWFSLYRTHLITYFSLIDFVSSLFRFKLCLIFVVQLKQKDAISLSHYK